MLRIKYDNTIFPTSSLRASVAENTALNQKEAH